MMNSKRLDELLEYVKQRQPGYKVVDQLLAEYIVDRARLLSGNFTEAEAAELIRCVVARQGLTRAQVEIACWEWQERTFGPRKTDGTTSLIGTKGDFDGTYPTDQEVVPGGKTERVPGRDGGV